MVSSSENKISRRTFVGTTLGAAAAASSIFGESDKPTPRPNLLFILADDLGWGDLSCYGRPDYRTPVLGKLALEGTRFTNAYSAAPVCTPTRVGFHTGRYPARLAVGLEEPINERSSLGERVNTVGIPTSHPTVSSLIKAAGYDTALIGKWHVGYYPDFGPLRFGYDEFFGIMSGAADHFSHKDMSDHLDLYEGEVPVERIGYATDLLTEKAIEYVSRARKDPFYLSLHYTAPHWPWEGPGDAAFSKALKYSPAGFRAGGSIKVYGEMVKCMDAGIGRVLAALKAAGLDRSTLVIFTSDNGGERFSYNWPFTGQKMDLHEGGVRVPAIVRWPGVTKAGTVTDQPVITMDWTATMIAAAGGKPDPAVPLDGVDLAGFLAGKTGNFERQFYWRIKRQGAMRSGNWKYLREGNVESLFDLARDEREQANFADLEPEKLDNLRKLFKSWEAQVQQYPKTQP